MGSSVFLFHEPYFGICVPWLNLQCALETLKLLWILKLEYMHIGKQTIVTCLISAAVLALYVRVLMSS